MQRLTSGSLPSDTVGDTQRAIGILTENQIAHLLGCSGLKWTQKNMLPPLWLDVLVCLDKESRQAFLNSEFSTSKTKDPDLLFQMTEQMRKDLSKLYLGRGIDLNYDARHHGFAPISITPLTADDCREQ